MKVKPAARNIGTNDPTGNRNYANGVPIKDAQQAKWKRCPGCDKCRDTGGWVLRRGSWRRTRAHEMVFMFTKAMNYYTDQQAIAEKAVGNQPGNAKTNKRKENANRNSVSISEMTAHETRNPRSVMSLSNEPLKLKHFAAYPTELVRPLLMVSTPEKGCCPKCGAPWARKLRKKRVATRPGDGSKVVKSGRDTDVVGNRDPERHIAVVETVGWMPTCKCGCEDTVPALVVDPFNGAGTTGLVARRLGLRYIGTELNPDYAAMARKRIYDDAPLMNAVPA